MRRTCPVRGLLLLALLVVPALGFGQDPDYVLSLPTTSAIQGETVLLTVGFDNTGLPISGFSYGVCHDPEALELLSATEVGTTTETINGGAAPAFISIAIEVGGWTMVVAIDYLGNDFLDPGLGYTLGTGTYFVVGSNTVT